MPMPGPGPPCMRGPNVPLTMSVTRCLSCATICCSCAAVRRPLWTALSSSAFSASTIAWTRPSAVLPCALATSESVLPDWSCVRSCASVKPRYVAAAVSPSPPRCIPPMPLGPPGPPKPRPWPAAILASIASAWARVSVPALTAASTWSLSAALKASWSAVGVTPSRPAASLMTAWRWSGEPQSCEAASAAPPPATAARATAPAMTILRLNLMSTAPWVLGGRSHHSRRG